MILPLKHKGDGLNKKKNWPFARFQSQEKLATRADVSRNKAAICFDLE